MKKFIIILTILLGLVVIPSFSVEKASADELSDNIEEQLENIDLSELENFFNDANGDFDFFQSVYNLLNGKFDFDFSTVFEYIFKLFFSNVKNFAPTLITIVAISVFCSLINSVKGTFFSDEIGNVIYFVCFLTIILLFSSEIIILYRDTLSVIKNIGRLNEILSPVLLTLMIASGGSVSATVYKPAVAILSGTIIHLVLYLVLPLVILNFIFAVLSNFSETVKLKKFSELFSSIIKWIIGLSITVFGIFMSAQGIASACFDGISIKATKYAISNSVPIIGGFLRDGFDIVIAGSILIKNSIGVAVLVSLFYNLLAPVMQIIAFSLVLKFISAITEPITDGRISDFCSAVSKCVTYFLVCILFVAFMFFIMVILMIFTANSFI